MSVSAAGFVFVVGSIFFFGLSLLATSGLFPGFLAGFLSIVARDDKLVFGRGLANACVEFSAPVDFAVAIAVVLSLVGFRGISGGSIGIYSKKFP